MALLGLDAIIYRNTGSFLSPQWQEVPETRNQAIDESMHEADTTNRGSRGVRTQEPTTRSLAVQFEIKNGCENAKVFQAVFSDRKEIDLAILDDEIGSKNPVGIRARFKVFECTKEQSITEAQWIKIKLVSINVDGPPEEFEHRDDSILARYF